MEYVDGEQLMHKNHQTFWSQMRQKSSLSSEKVEIFVRKQNGDDR